MSDEVERLEAARRRLTLKQIEVARHLGITQGHYSKVVRRIAPPGPALGSRIADWLLANDPGAAADDGTRRRVATLARSIRTQCDELVLLLASSRLGPT